MKSIVIGMLVLGMSAVLLAQEKGPDTQVPTGTISRRADFQNRNNGSLSTMIAYGSFSVGGEDRFGPMLILQYSPTRASVPSLDFFGGVLIQTGSSSQVNPNDFVPAVSYVVPYYSPYSSYRNENYYRMPNFSLGMGFLGADVTFYMLQGDVQPYLGFGGSLALWSYSSRLSGTVAPDAKAGINLRVSNAFSGFAEVRRMFGVPNLLNLSGPKFDGLTSAALGVSFTPRLRP